jgi:hypothetical protein
VPSETVLSLLRRLATAHRVALGAVLRQIGAGKSDLPPDGGDVALIPAAWSRLAIMTGRDVSDLRRAIGAAPMPTRRLHSDHQPFVVTILIDDPQVVAACRPCCLQRGVLDDTVEIRPPTATHMCWRHQLWLVGRQLDISSLPELLRAHHRHARLAARHDPGHLESTETIARDIIAGWRRDPRHRMATRFRSREVLISAQHASGVVPASLTTYPEMVHFIAMISSPHWSAVAGQGRQGQDRFLLEANHRLGTHDLQYASPYDPLLVWLRTANGHRGRVAADPKQSSPLLKNPPLQLPGWEAPTMKAPPRRRIRMSAAYRASLNQSRHGCCQRNGRLTSKPDHRILEYQRHR